jgi:hypothetical protein
MNPTLSAGLLLGVLVAVWTFVMGLTGWYRHPSLLLLFWMVIPIQIAAVVWGLRRTASRTDYGWQVINGVVISVIASLIIFGASLFFTTVAFPQYFKDLEALGRLKMAQEGLAPERIEEIIRMQAPWQKPLPTAFSGVFGTWVTGLVTSLIAAAFLRRKGR